MTGPAREADGSAAAGVAKEPASTAAGPLGRPWDPRAVRVSLAQGAAPEGLRSIVVEPPETAAVTARGPAGVVSEGVQGLAFAVPDDTTPRIVLVDGIPVEADLRVQGPGRATLVVGGSAAGEHRILFPAGAASRPGGAVTRLEVVVDGWRFELEVEPAARAVLRERAGRGRAAATHSGPTEVRAIIPGVVAAVSVAAGDIVVAGQQLLVIEAMKMQNELRAPRGGTIERVSVGPGARIDVGDLLVIVT